MNIPPGDWGAQFRWSFGDTQAQEALHKHQGALQALELVYDNDGLWDWGDPWGEGSHMIRRMVDQYAQVGAWALVWGCGNNLAWSYTPRVQEAWCDRVPRREENLRQLAERQRQWLDAGTDPLAVVLERARMHHLPVLAGFRLNRFFQIYGVESWYEDNPQFVLSPASCPLNPHQYSVDLARPEVRRHFVEHSIDVVERYEVQGLHLEFMRAIPFFERGQEDKAAYLNEFLRQLRWELDRIGRQRGCHLELSIWSGTPQNYRVIRKGIFPPEFCELEFHGIDIPTWISEGLVDRLMLSAWSGGPGRRGMPVELAPWVEQARGSRTRILGEIDNAWELPEPERLREAESVIRQIAATSDGVFLFNIQPYALALILEGARQN
ncbi:MAG: hypothetical protein HYW07_17605 [Candidatus Latescibacteria bacterium]|nr:hypothetical protein [Candidatus Latescibacterota bacterium]